MLSNKEYSESHTDLIYNRFMNLALNRFKWGNLPAGLTSRKMEEYLISHGRSMFFKNELGAFICLPCNGVKDFNVYNEPTTYTVIGNNYTKDVTIDEGVVIRNNTLATSDIEDILLFSEKINEVEQTQDINLYQQNTPYLYLCDEKQKLTLKNVLLQVKKFKYAIFGSKSLSSLKGEMVVNTKADFLLDKLQEHKQNLVNEMLTYLGINNSNINKKERLITDEVNANNEYILCNLDHMYEERRLAVEEINRKFKLNITVELREVDLIGTDDTDDTSINRE